MSKATNNQFTATRAFHREFIRTDPFRRYGAHAVGVGWKMEDGRKTERPALRIYVQRKVLDSELPPDWRLPSEFSWTGPDGQVTTIVTDVIESAQGRPLMVDPESRIRPVPGGVSGSAMRSGTLGAWVWDTVDDSIVMLSNAHVFGFAAGESILQPADTDGGQLATDRIGEVKRAVEVTPVVGPSPWPEEQCNFVDAAIGAADSSDLMELTVLEVGPGIYATTVAAIDMPIEMAGQTTGHTTGVVDDVEYAAAYNTPLGPGNWQVVGYCDLIRILPTEPGVQIGISGDSGSVAFTPDPDSVINPAVGLVAWGNGGGEAIACKIQNVFEELRVDVLCSGGFEAFLDALAEDGHDLGAARAVSLFEPRRPRPARAIRLSNGLARDVQKRLGASKTGRTIVNLVQHHRAELLTMLLLDGDTRRSTVAALRPLLRGAATTDSVFHRRITKEDLERIGHSLDIAIGRGSSELAADIAKLRLKLKLADRVDQSIGEIIEG